MPEVKRELTKDELDLMEVVRVEYEKRFFTYRKIDPAEGNRAVELFYKIGGADKMPKVHIVQSPRAAAEFIERLEGRPITDYQFSNYLSIFDLVWLAFYDYFLRIGENLDSKDFVDFLYAVRDCGIYDSIQTPENCILVEMPLYSKIEEGNLHCADGPAMEFSDGFSLYYWRNIAVPKKLIMAPELVTKSDILSQDNAELRRCYMEVLGAKRYYDIVTDGQGLRKVDSGLDNQGNMMVLWETNKVDSISGTHIQFLEVVCPSTGRIYNLYPPRKCSTAKEAKGSTFADKPLIARQGDVGIVEYDEEGNLVPYEEPLVET